MTTMPNILEALAPREPFLVSEQSDGEGRKSRATIPLHEHVAREHYENFDVVDDAENEILWWYMNPAGRPSFTPSVLQDLTRLQHSIKQMSDANDGRLPYKYVVLGSRAPGVWNLGGDLAHFVARIREGDREAMTRYAHHCTEVVHRNTTSFNAPVITIALVQGDTLGGGLECALSLNMIVAEKSAKMGLPEILFNLFPGMGAYSFLSRRLDGVRAEKIITSGRLYSAVELHEMGLVDVLAEDGQGESALREYLAGHRRKWNAHYALFQARKRVNPVTLDELMDVTDIWVDAAMRLPEADLRKMERLVAAQNRRMASARNIPERIVA